VPNARSFHRLLALELGLIRSVTETSTLGARLQRVSELDRASLSTLVEQAGFRILRWSSYALKPFTHAQMEQLVAASWCPPGLIDGLDRMVKYMPELGSEMSIEVKLR
jgi:hypothetical protein